MDDDLWLTLMLYDKYNTENERERICKEIAEKHRKTSADIYSVSKNLNFALSYYIFVKIKDRIEKTDILQNFSGYFDSNGCSIITSKEFFDMTKSVDKSYGYVKFGDVVLIKTGRYRKLYGIVLRKAKNDGFCVGIKLCSETVCQDYHENELTSVSNIFKFIKINQRNDNDNG